MRNVLLIGRNLGASIPVLKYLYIALAIAISAGWWADRTHQFYAGKDECRQAYTDQIAKDSERQKQEQQKKIEAAVEEALKADKHVNSLQETKARVIEHTKTIVVTKPASCNLSDAELRDYND